MNWWRRGAKQESKTVVPAPPRAAAPPHPSEAWAKSLVDEFVAWKQYPWDDRPEDHTFRTLTSVGRPWAMIRTESTDDGILSWFAVEPTTGVFAWMTQRFGACIEFCGVHPKGLARLLDPSLVPSDDPIRRWLAADPADGPVPVEVSTVDHFHRFSAAEIWRSDDPTRAAAPQLRCAPGLAAENPALAGLPHVERLHPDFLPYYALWKGAFSVPGPWGRRTGWTREATDDERLNYSAHSGLVLDEARAIGLRLREVPPVAE
ncbi:hypothetical protein RKE30_35740 [Streptomyces sp. Li-HN-5-11]|uniref:hypothetical protein n=1 Tax=Streptomyces sp. Li-HN-5-11 TaxID=3075432 RepID=UPI0028B11975|nr:hypothetical protein [Streptomyces sp. Li-HN-5-11]WNM35340.1 hypothetical protein RKE30_35740 [Streptomyces sp. Li-HN-5-11]